MRWGKSHTFLSVLFVSMILSPRLAFCGSSPRLVSIPESAVLYAPDVLYDLFSLQGTWFYRYKGQWFQSHRPQGPWVYIPDPRVPDPLRRIPQELKKSRRVTQRRREK